jgi:hypothetical protein
MDSESAVTIPIVTVTRPNKPRPAPIDPAKIGRATNSPDKRQVELGTIGFTADQSEWPEDTPAWIRLEQGEPLVEVTLRDTDKITARLSSSIGEVSFGQQCVVLLPDGDPQLAVIVAVLHDSRFTTPSKVCGVETGAADATQRGEIQPAPTWEFKRLGNGRMVAIQTQGADVLIWSGGSVHVRSSTANLAGAPDGAIHLDGRVALGARPLAAPMGSSVSPGGDEVPGVLAVPAVAVPYAPPTPVAPNTVTPYVGNTDGIVRAHDMYISTAAIDPATWAWIIAVDAVARVLNPALPPLPISLHSAISGVGGVGSQHTAEGDKTP